MYRKQTHRTLLCQDLMRILFHLVAIVKRLFRKKVTATQPKGVSRERRRLGALRGRAVDEGRLEERKTCTWHTHGAAAEVVRSIGLGAAIWLKFASRHAHLSRPIFTVVPFK